MTAGRAPNLKVERDMLAGGNLLVAGCDEVGRGSLGGPVSVGMVVVDAATRRPPAGLRDSKLLAPQVRESLVPRIESWSCCWAIGHASAAEIDEIGILRALRLAGERALALLRVRPDLVLLDGNYDWFTRPERSAVLACGDRAGAGHAQGQGRPDLCLGRCGKRDREGVPATGTWSSSPVGTRRTAGSRTRATRPRSTVRRCSRSGRARSTEGPGTSSSPKRRRCRRGLQRDTAAFAAYRGQRTSQARWPLCGRGFPSLG